MTRQKWTNQRVLDDIRQRHRRRLPLTGMYRADRFLVAAARRYFGTWKTALTAAGFPVEPKIHWIPEMILAAIQQRHRAGLPLGGAYRYDPSLGRAAWRSFGSWREAVSAAGIRGIISTRWTSQRIIAELQAMRQRGVPVTTTSAPASLRDAALRLFGGWHDALEAAGIDPLRRKCRRWTAEGIVDEIRSRQRQGLPLTMAANRSLAKGAMQRFGTWSRALQAAGIPTPARTRWTRERILHDLRVCDAQHSFDKTSWTGNRRLACAARRHFGSWRAALIAAGILAPHETIRYPRKWTDERIITTIQDRYIRGLPLTVKADTNLHNAACRHFGNWHAAMKAAGMEPGKTRDQKHRTVAGLGDSKNT